MKDPAPPSPTILDVDLLRFERGGEDARRAVVDGVSRSLGTGFVYVRTGIPEETIDEAYDAIARCFRLPLATKRRHVVPGSFGQTGYTGLLVETAAGADAADWKEMWNYGLELPPAHPLRRRFPHRYADRSFPEPEVPGIGRLAARLYDALLDVQRRFLRVVALGLGVHEGLFDGLLAGGPTLCRALRYPPIADAPGPAHVWAREHADINLTTALPRATARGLEVRIGDRFVEAVAPPGFAILNSGLMLERLSNGRIPAGLHRVVAPPGERGERFSLVQFCHPTPTTILAPLSTCTGPDRPQRFAPIEAGAWLDEVLYDINLRDG